MASAEYQRQWREKNKKRVLEYQRNYRNEHQEHLRQLVGEGVKRWRAANPELNKERNQEYKRIRRARISGARVEKYIQMSSLHNWYSRICGICQQFIEGNYHIDHIVPLSRGGDHSAINLQLAHPFCNQSKFTKLTEELKVIQSPV